MNKKGEKRQKKHVKRTYYVPIGDNKFIFVLGSDGMDVLCEPVNIYFYSEAGVWLATCI